MAGWTLKLKWSDHLNSAWLAERPEELCQRDVTEQLYTRLLETKEVVPQHDSFPMLPGAKLPDFESDSGAAGADHEAFVNSLLTLQLSLAAAEVAEAPFSAVLRRRLVVLRRIFHALSAKYHDAGQAGSLAQSRRGSERAGAEGEADDSGGCGGGGGHSALIAMSVKTGLTLVFALLRQSWAQQSGAAIGTDVLQTALDTVGALPPLSLASDAKLSPIGRQSLADVSRFLRSVALPSSTADAQGRLLASQLLLGLAVQRGSLRHLLDWLDMALAASTEAAPRPDVSRPVLSAEYLGRMLRVLGGRDTTGDAGHLSAAV
ncbi:probable E3 ubiquitin-protein ligase HERC1 [Pollicipes pollicipes]|uniref:probable E3 ubiquitin-protein ligase HERC1 n=1 Tax=Pollicipes pollicipes TaxID=41117 RepID=UPI0018851AB6|nr:probable E3 ubiquitin-protein ligase HERC1 [Pollicipes pollicipes]